LFELCIVGRALANLEAGRPSGLFVLDVDPVDAGAPRTLTAELDQPLDCVALALEDRLDGAVGSVADVAGDLARERTAPDGLAEEDSLDVTLDDNPAPLHRL